MTKPKVKAKPPKPAASPKPPMEPSEAPTPVMHVRPLGECSICEKSVTSDMRWTSYGTVPPTLLCSTKCDQEYATRPRA